MDELIELMARTYSPYAWEMEAENESTLRVRERMREHARERSRQVLAAISSSTTHRLVEIGVVTERMKQVGHIALVESDATSPDGDVGHHVGFAALRDVFNAMLASSPTIGGE